MLRSCVLDFKVEWERYLSLAELSYNNNFQSSIVMEPFKALNGRKCRSVVCRTEVGERKLSGLEMVQPTTDKIKVVQKWLETAQN